MARQVKASGNSDWTIWSLNIRGNYNYLGLPIGKALNFVYVYVYVLSKKAGQWTLRMPYKVVFNELVHDRVDFNQSHAMVLYDKSQIENPNSVASGFNLKVNAEPIKKHLCADSIDFPGGKAKYAGKGLHQRDK